MICCYLKGCSAEEYICYLTKRKKSNFKECVYCVIVIRLRAQIFQCSPNSTVFKNKWLLNYVLHLAPKAQHSENESPCKVQCYFIESIRGPSTTLAFSQLPVIFTGGLGSAIIHSFTNLPSCVSGSDISLLTEANSSLSEIHPIPRLQNTVPTITSLKNPLSANAFSAFGQLLSIPYL